MKYIPQPIFTEDITLSDELVTLTEKMAHNVHEVWAQERMAQGWQFGPQRNDKLKQHPCLIPYEELSESEREFDRKTALETLKLLVALGYDITKAE